MKQKKDTVFNYNMSLINKEVIKTNNHILYSDLVHTYQNTLTNEYYKSVTTLLNTLHVPFKATLSNTRKTEIDLNMTHEQVIQYWKDINKYSTTYGSFIHGFLEHYLLGLITTKKELKEKYLINLANDTSLNERFLLYYNYVKELKLKRKEKVSKTGKIHYKLFIEAILYNDIYKIAGQCDIMVIDSKGIHIHDWKTNQDKQLEDINVYSPRLAEPLGHLSNSKLIEYQLQLSIYAYFAELMYNLPVASLTIHHLDKENCKMYSLDYLKKDVILLLEAYKNKLK